MVQSVIGRAREAFHQNLIADKVLTASASGIASNADSKSTASKEYAAGIARAIGGVPNGKKLSGPIAGSKFEAACAEFLRNTFLALPGLPRDNWAVEHVRSRGDANFLAGYAQYAHLAELEFHMGKSLELSATLSNAYAIAPDIVVSRQFPRPLPQSYAAKIDATRAFLRVDEAKSLHAIISCK